MHVHILNIESMKPIKKIFWVSWGRRRPPCPPQLAPLNENGQDHEQKRERDRERERERGQGQGLGLE